MLSSAMLFTGGAYTVQHLDSFGALHASSNDVGAFLSESRS